MTLGARAGRAPRRRVGPPRPVLVWRFDRARARRGDHGARRRARRPLVGRQRRGGPRLPPRRSRGHVPRHRRGARARPGRRRRPAHRGPGARRAVVLRRRRRVLRRHGRRVHPRRGRRRRTARGRAGSRARSTSCAGCPRRWPTPRSSTPLVTATEAKAQALVEAGVPGTGTASDAVVVCCPPGGTEPYGGPRSVWGARLARAGARRRARPARDRYLAGLSDDHARARRGPVGQVRRGRAAGRPPACARSPTSPPPASAEDDADHVLRVAAHRARRDPAWTTVEAGADLVGERSRRRRARCWSTRSAPGSPPTPTCRPTSPGLVRRAPGATGRHGRRVGGGRPRRAPVLRARPPVPRRPRRGQPGGGRRRRRRAPGRRRPAAAAGHGHEAGPRLPHARSAARPRPIARTLSWFPLAGCAHRRWPSVASGGARTASGRPPWRPRIVVAADLALTGLLHVDGLVDSADGLLPQLSARAAPGGDGRADRRGLRRGGGGRRAPAALRRARVDGRRRAARRRRRGARPARRWRSRRAALPYARAGGGLATALLGGDWRLGGGLRRDRGARARRVWPTARRPRWPWSAGLWPRAAVRGLRRGAGSAGSPATCSAPPAWWRRRSRSSWRRRVVSGAALVATGARSGSWPTGCSASRRTRRTRWRGFGQRHAAGRAAARTRDGRSAGVAHAAVGLGLGWPPARCCVERSTAAAGDLRGGGRTRAWATRPCAVGRRARGRRPRPAPERSCRRWWAAIRRSSTTRRWPAPSWSRWPRTPSTRSWRRRCGPRWPARRACSRTGP